MSEIELTPLPSPEASRQSTARALVDAGWVASLDDAEALVKQLWPDLPGEITLEDDRTPKPAAEKAP